jgi:hypothetical protein
VNVKTPTGNEWYSPRYLIFPGFYIVIIVLTTALSMGAPDGAFYRVIGLCPPAGSVMMVFENASVIVGAFLLLGTPWWYMVGRIGWDSYERRRGFFASLGGAALAFFTCFISGVMTRGVFRQDTHSGRFTTAMIAQYWLAALLCLGSLVSTLFALGAAVRPKRES